MSIKAAIIALLALQQTEALQCHKYDGETPDGEISQKDRNQLVDCEECPLGHIDVDGVCTVEVDDGECQIEQTNCAVDSEDKAKLASIYSFQACKCAECKEGYYYDENFNCVSPLDCPTPVDNCEEQDYHTCACYKCEGEFINVDGVCKAQSEVCQEDLKENCLKQDGECKCTACEVGFEVVEGECSVKKVCETELTEGCIQQDPDCNCIVCNTADYELNPLTGLCELLPVCEEPLKDKCVAQDRECNCTNCEEGNYLEDGECKELVCEPIDGCKEQALNCSCIACDDGKVHGSTGCVDENPGTEKCDIPNRCPPNVDIYLANCKKQDCHTCRCAEEQCEEGFALSDHFFCEAI